MTHWYQHRFPRLHRWGGSMNWGGVFIFCPACWQEKRRYPDDWNGWRQR